MIVHGAIGAVYILDRECYNWATECSNALSGASGSLDDSTVFSSQTAKLLRWPTAKLYTSVYLKQEDKERIAKMVEEIKAAYHGIIEEADFLSDETRANAIEKLDAISINSLYPDDWDKYSCEALEIKGVDEGGTLWEAVRNLTRFTINQLTEKLSKPVDKDEWAYPPQTVNCFYSPTANGVFILGAFAQGGIYNSDMSDEEMLAKLGSVIVMRFPMRLIPRVPSLIRMETSRTGGPRRTSLRSRSVTSRCRTITAPSIPGRYRIFMPVL